MRALRNIVTFFNGDIKIKNKKQNSLIHNIWVTGLFLLFFNDSKHLESETDQLILNYLRTSTLLRPGTQ